MTTYPVEEMNKEWLLERIHYAMIESLYKQNMITEAQRRELCAILKCDILNICKKKG